MRRCLCLLVLACSCAPELPGRFRLLHRNSTPRASQRRRLHSDDLIADPGTVELDIGGFFSGDTRALPLTAKWTPGGGGFWSRTELSASFDSVTASFAGQERWITQFSDRIGVAANHVAFSTENLQVAVAPQASFLLRGNDGVRLGATLLAKYDAGWNTFAGSAGWSGATHASDSNPSGDWEAGGAYVRRISASLAAYTSLFFENATTGDSALTHSSGCTWQRSKTMEFDVAFRRVKPHGSGWDNQGVVTMTLIFGKRE